MFQSSGSSTSFQPSVYSAGFDSSLGCRGPETEVARPNKKVANKQEIAYFEQAQADLRKWKTYYEQCKQSRKKKGKTWYPSPKAKLESKGPFYDDCRNYYKLRDRAAERVAKMANDLKIDLKRKGKLTPELSDYYDDVKAQPGELKADDINDIETDPTSGNKGRSKGKGKGKGPGGLPTSEEVDADQGFPIWVLGLGAVVAIGGIGYMVMSKKKKKAAKPAPKLITTS